MKARLHAEIDQLPEGYRIQKARTVLGPSGAWWLKDRVDGVVDVLTGHGVREAVADPAEAPVAAARAAGSREPGVWRFPVALQEG